MMVQLREMEYAFSNLGSSSGRSASADPSPALGLLRENGLANHWETPLRSS